MSRVWLIRHGQSEANAGLRSANAAGIPLTAVGHAQAEAVARAFVEPPAGIHVSPYWRAEQTSLPTRARFPAARVENRPVHEFTYLSPEHCRDTTSAERLPRVQAYWARANADECDGPGAETLREFLVRVDAAIAEWRGANGLLAVFTHGQFMQAVMWRLGAGPQPSGPEHMAALRDFMIEVEVPNAAILELQLDAKNARLDAFRLEHLADLPVTA